MTESAQVDTTDPPRAALELLLQGPKVSGHFSEIPAGVHLEDLGVTDSTAAVSLGANFFASGGSTGMQARLAQVVYTLTQFPQMTAVQFLQDGHPATVAGGEGFPLNRPLTRGSFTVVAG
ncbi:MAG TPA: GerMN domain-containing protein [Chloroflexota bacterium]